MSSCPSADELFLLLDGEVTENRAAELRAHAASCPSCAAALRVEAALLSDLSAPVPGVPSPAGVAAVMRRIAERQAATRSRRLARWALPAAALALAASVAGIAVLVRQPEPSGFVPRGAPAAWERKVGFELWSVEQPPRRLPDGASVSSETAYVARLRNLTGASVFLLAFALDDAGEVHWLYPAYQDARTDPPSRAVPPAPDATTLPDSVVLEDVPAGTLQVFAVISPSPLSVLQVERLPASELDPARLRERFRGSRVDVLRVRVTAARVP